MENSILRNRVKTLRGRLNSMTQLELANEAGVSRMTVINIEKGRMNPSVKLALKIARILREPLDYIFYLAPISE